MPSLVNPCGAHRADISGTDLAAGPIVVHSRVCYLRNVLVVSQNGNHSILFTDGVDGPVVGIIPPKTPAGMIFSLDMPIVNSICVAQTEGAGDLAVSFGE